MVAYNVEEWDNPGRTERVIHAKNRKAAAEQYAVNRASVNEWGGKGTSFQGIVRVWKNGDNRKHPTYFAVAARWQPATRMGGAWLTHGRVTYRRAIRLHKGEVA